MCCMQCSLEVGFSLFFPTPTSWKMAVASTNPAPPTNGLTQPAKPAGGVQNHPPLGAPSPLSQVRDLSKGLGSVSWHRAVLDEAHVIKGHKQATAQAAEGESRERGMLRSSDRGPPKLRGLNHAVRPPL